MTDCYHRRFTDTRFFLVEVNVVRGGRRLGLPFVIGSYHRHIIAKKEQSQTKTHRGDTKRHVLL